MTIAAIIGAQYGSEGKGVIVRHIADSYNVHIRTGGPNAGHSFQIDGRKYSNQMLPVGFVNPDARLIIGPGAVVDLDLLEEEVRRYEEIGYAIRSRLFVDSNAGVLDARHHNQEGGIDGELHHRIGSTGEGVGACRIARIRRDPERINRASSVSTDLNVCDTLPLVQPPSVRILLEGTQGSGLSLIHGPWPYVTSHDTNAAQLLADAGLPPRCDEVIMVARTHPIRVAGNSGPMESEISWEEISDRLGRDTLERTTVTKKVRRISEWDPELFERAVKLNHPTAIALTFLDYLNPADEGISKWSLLSDKSKQFINYVSTMAGCPVKWVGTGGPSWQIISLED